MLFTTFISYRVGQYQGICVLSSTRDLTNEFFHEIQCQDFSLPFIFRIFKTNQFIDIKDRFLFFGVLFDKYKALTFDHCFITAFGLSASLDMSLVDCIILKVSKFVNRKTLDQSFRFVFLCVCVFD